MKSASVLFLVLIIVFSNCKKEDDNITNGIAIVNPPDTTGNDSTIIVNARLEFQIKTFDNTNGQLVAALFNSSANYSANVIYKSSILPLSSVIMEIAFDSIPSGTYCFSCFHDDDSNNSLNQSILGLPTEGYGFSNNPGITFGAPPFSQIKFTVSASDTTKRVIDLIYL